MIPDNVEKIIMTKEDYDRNVEQLLYDKINAEQEIERLNKLISQREKKWEKWTTEKTILSTKMSDYLCKYQNIKREYTKQIKISTDRKKEVERLNNIIKEALEKSKGLQYRFGYVLDDLVYLLMQGSD